MVWFGLFLVLLGATLVFFSRRAGAAADLGRTVETSKIGALKALVADVAADLPGDIAGTGYTEFVEIKGIVRCDEPLTGELSSAAAAVVETKVERVFETREETRDAQGQTRVEWRRQRETVSQNRRESPFGLDDGSGVLRVSPGGSKMTLEKVVDRFEQAGAVEQMAGGILSIGFGSLRVSAGGALSGGRRTLGYQFTERILPIGRPIYALGEVADTADGMVLRKPSDGGKPFLLSMKTEEELLRGKERTAKGLKMGGGLALIAGIVLGVMGLF